MTTSDHESLRVTTSEIASKYLADVMMTSSLHHFTALQAATVLVAMASRKKNLATEISARVANLATSVLVVRS